jgi:hypothetical protein
MGIVSLRLIYNGYVLMEPPDKMKILLAILLFLPFLCPAADGSNRPAMLYIKKAIAGDESTYKFGIPHKDIFAEFNDVWRSKKGIECSAMIAANGKPTVRGSFECKATEGYKAQIAFDCSKNYSEKTSAYLFFGLVGAKGNNGNFYVWCE